MPRKKVKKRSYTTIVIKAWFFSIMLATIFTCLTLQKNPFEIYRDPVWGVTAFVIGNLLCVLLCVVLYDIFVQPVFLLKEKKYVKKITQNVDSKTNKIEKIKEVKKADIFNLDSNPHIVDGVRPEILTDDKGKEIKVYSWEDYKFNLNITPHVIIGGASGAGKTCVTFCLIDLLNKQYDNPYIVLCDAGNFDYDEAIAHQKDDIKYVVDLLFTIMKGRQIEKDKNAKRIIFIIEEAESWVDEISLDKKSFERTITKLKSMGRMARKTNINQIIIVQSGKADTIPTDWRKNLSNRFVLRSFKSVLGTGGHNLEGLTTGAAYNNTVGGFIKFDMIEKPTMNLLSMENLARLAKAYKNKHNILDKEEIEELERL